jgi:hypothetical protein
MARDKISASVYELYRAWQQWRLSQPPFLTKEGDVYIAHPVTPENAYLLRPPPVS